MTGVNFKLFLAAPNPDFDGDEMNLALWLDCRHWTHSKRLAPEDLVLDLRRPKPVIETVANWQQQNS